MGGDRSQEKLRIAIVQASGWLQGYALSASLVTLPPYGHVTLLLLASLYVFFFLSSLYLLTNFLSVFHLNLGGRESFIGFTNYCCSSWLEF